MWTWLRRSFVTGLVVTVPLVVTTVALVWLVQGADFVTQGLDQRLIGRRVPGLGIAITLDDFGTGYSSLSQLLMFPFDKIKVDKSFTQNLTKRTECAAIIAATLTLARSLDIETTAEGVETADQYRLLRLAGVTSLQGFLFQAPCAPSEIDFRSAYRIPEVENAA